MAKIDLYGEDEAKKYKTQQVLWTVLEKALKLLHPFMPFITEEIWQHLPHDGISIMVSSWPEFKPEWDFSDASDMEIVMDAVRGIRNIRAELNVSPGKKAEATARVSDAKVLKLLEDSKEIIYSLAKVSHMEIGGEDLKAPSKSVSCVIKGAEILISMEDLVDIDAEVQRLQKEIEHLNKEIERLDKKLSNQGFVSKAPRDVVEKEREKRENYRDMLQKVEKRLKTITDIS
jgi:valyl-tRNA synthetase